MSDWQGLHNCPTCGELVQLYTGPRTPLPRLFDAGTWQRHRCAGNRAPEIGDTIECARCGKIVERMLNGHKVNMDGTVHTCGKLVQVVPPPARQRVPVAAPAPASAKRRHSVEVR